MLSTLKQHLVIQHVIRTITQFSSSVFLLSVKVPDENPVSISADDSPSIFVGLKESSHPRSASIAVVCKALTFGVYSFYDDIDVLDST